MAKVSALRTTTAGHTTLRQPTLRGLPTALVCEMLTQLGFRVRSQTAVYPDGIPATIVTWRKRTPQGKANVQLFIFPDDSCRVTVTHSHFRDAAEVWKLLKQL